MKDNDHKKTRICLSFMAFFLIGLLNSCQEIHIKKEQEAKQAIDLNVPKINWEEILKPVEEDSVFTK